MIVECKTRKAQEIFLSNLPIKNIEAATTNLLNLLDLLTIKKKPTRSNLSVFDKYLSFKLIRRHMTHLTQ